MQYESHALLPFYVLCTDGVITKKEIIYMDMSSGQCFNKNAELIVDSAVIESIFNAQKAEVVDVDNSILMEIYKSQKEIDNINKEKIFKEDKK